MTARCNYRYRSNNAARIAWLKDGLVKTDATVKDGVVNNKFTGDWVVMTVPASEGLFSATKLARLKNTASLLCGKHRLLTSARSAHQHNSFQKLMFLQLLYFKEGIQQYTICQGVPTSGNYANQVIAAYFTNKNYEMAGMTKN